MLLRDEALAGQVRAAVDHAEQATANLNHASARADALMSDLSSRQIPKKAGEMMDELGASSRQIHQLITEVTQPDEDGMSASAHIRVSLKNANTATTNLADATEALKHNFFTKGFFKDRGYYSLGDMSAEDYRRNRALAGRTQRRLWLPGSELFQSGVDGDEQLSGHGNALLKATFAEHADALVESPIVVEGYWNGDIRAERFRVSRHRAMIVRQYLQKYFELEPKNLGAVPMENVPPSAAGRPTWDGICLVLLKRS
jgi:phospholipid/cholesterol/gamma-HCH transport system substrate-binding protein